MLPCFHIHGSCPGGRWTKHLPCHCYTLPCITYHYISLQIITYHYISLHIITYLSVAGRPVGRPLGRSAASRSVCRWAGGPVGRSAGRSVGRSVGRPVGRRPGRGAWYQGNNFRYFDANHVIRHKTHASRFSYSRLAPRRPMDMARSKVGPRHGQK